MAATVDTTIQSSSPGSGGDMVISDISVSDIENVEAETGDIEKGIIESDKSAAEDIATTTIVDVEAGIEVPAPLNQVGLIPPPRTPGGRLLLAPPTPKLNMSDSRPTTASKPLTKLEKLRKLRTIAVVEFEKRKPKFEENFKNLSKNFHASMVGVWLTKIDFWLDKHLSHHLRYYWFLIFFQLFPIIFLIFRAKPTTRKKCDEPLETYIIGSGVLAFMRIATGLCVMQRISNRDWPGQTFGEAMGQVWNLTEKQGNYDDSFVSGYRLNALIICVVGTDIGFWFFGFFTLIVSQSAICADRVTTDAVALVCYQFFNIFFFSAYIDIILPYFFLEFDPDVDVYVAGTKNSSGDQKRKMMLSMERRKRAAEKEKERARKRMGIKVIQVAPHDAADKKEEGKSKKKSGKEKSVEEERPETAWWEKEKGLPPRKKKVNNQVGPSSIKSSEGGSVTEKKGTGKKKKKEKGKGKKKAKL